MKDEIIQSYLTILKVTSEIDNRFAEIVEKYIPTSPHRDSKHYYMNNHCASYADILLEIFQGYAQAFVGDGHVVVKIGNFFVDGSGIYISLPDNTYRLIENNYFEIATLALRSNDGTDEIIAPHLIAIGKAKLNQILEDYVDTSKKTR